MNKILTLITTLFFCQALTAQVGIGTNNPKALLHVDTGAVIFSGPTNLLNPPDNSLVSGEGSRFLWYPKKAALRSGNVFGVHGANWDKDSIGTASVATGINTKARGHASFAANYFTSASGNNSFAAGQSSHAKGVNSTALGYGSVANGYESLAGGISSTTNGSASFAFGVNCYATNWYSTAIGEEVISKVSGGMAVGTFNDTTDDAGHFSDNFATDRLFQVGNGTSNATRSNALTVLRSGNVGIGALIPEAKLHLRYNSGVSLPHLLLEEPQNDYARLSFKNATTNNVWSLAASPGVTNQSAQMNFFYQGYGDVLKLYGNGNATLTGTLTQNSDARLKKNIRPVNNSLAALDQLSGYRYQWKDVNRDNDVQIGLLAQEVETVFPELVTEDEKGMLSVNYAGLIPVLINAVKEQQLKIEELEKTVKALAKKVR